MWLLEHHADGQTAAFEPLVQTAEPEGAQTLAGYGQQSWDVQKMRERSVETSPESPMLWTPESSPEMTDEIDSPRGTVSLDWKASMDQNFGDLLAPESPLGEEPDLMERSWPARRDTYGPKTVSMWCTEAG